MGTEQKDFLDQKAQVIDGLVSYRLATPLRKSRRRDAPAVACIMPMGRNEYTQEFLLVSKGGLTDNSVVWVSPEYGKITGDGGALNRVIGALTERVPVVIPEDLPFEGIPGHLIGDEQVQFGVNRIKPLAEKGSTDIFLQSALDAASDYFDPPEPLSNREKEIVRKLIEKFPIP